VCKLLVDLGADANDKPNCWYEDRSHLRPATTYMLNIFSSVITVALLNAVAINFPGKVQEGLDIIRLLLSKAEVEPDELMSYRGPREGFILLQQYISPQYYEKPLEERAIMAISLTIENIWCGPELFWAALACDQFPCGAIGVKDTNNQTVLHAVGKSIGEIAMWMVQEPYLVMRRRLTLKEHKENLEGKTC
jgi:hypothetical protein